MDRTELEERVERLRVIAVAMNSIVQSVAPELIRLAHLREESRKIIGEIGARPRG